MNISKASHSVRLALESLERRLQPGSMWSVDLAGIVGSLLGPALEEFLVDAPATSKEAISAIGPMEIRGASEVEAVAPRVVGSSLAADVSGVALSQPEIEPRLLAALLSLAVSSGPTIQESDGNWIELAPMPTARQEIASAALGDEIFVIAGIKLDMKSSDIVEAYNVKTNTWRTIAPLPVITDHAAAAVALGTLYVIAGHQEAFFAYDPVADAWKPMAKMVHPHWGSPAVAVIDGKIYVAGGAGGKMLQNEVEVYDPVTNTWTQLAPMNVPRNHTTGGAINGKFYVAGGREGEGSETAFEVYDPATNTWSFLAPMPTGRSGIGSGVIDGCLYVFGGEGGRVFHEVEIYNPITNTWRETTPMRLPRHGIWGTTIGNAIYFAGGGVKEGYGATDAHDAFLVNWLGTSAETCE